MAKPMEEINIQHQIFTTELYKLLDEFNNTTGCYIENIELQHQKHYTEYEKTIIVHIGIGLIGSRFFTKKEKK